MQIKVISLVPFANACLGQPLKKWAATEARGGKNLCQNDKSYLDIFSALKRDIQTIYVDVVIRGRRRWMRASIEGKIGGKLLTLLGVSAIGE